MDKILILALIVLLGVLLGFTYSQILGFLAMIFKIIGTIFTWLSKIISFVV